MGDPHMVRERRIKKYCAELMHPYYAAESGFVDEVIDSGEIPEMVVRCVDVLRAKDASLPQGKHANSPQ
ncbi:carboxyl transferase domain-containing protein [Amycolatopsis carbonis]|uniref:Carboxyl transferase domain-containing protein n=1 Tax=Amycolatopsis carbonis TaxID=715471 RepID=A0A9Y2IDE1_9PSEU|nr:carboxyl transferase domain-containing protein [Amycolatopsis sp. 2-15]WIX76941.1 carboxyl transferase domain-containing protein [Amycolatopsis sp. 2-15]